MTMYNFAPFDVGDSFLWKFCIEFRFKLIVFWCLKISFEFLIKDVRYCYYYFFIIIEDFIFVFMNYLHNLRTRVWASYVTLNHFHCIQTVYTYSWR